MAKTRVPKKVDNKAAGIADAYMNHAVEVHLKAADVPPRKALDINFSDASKIGDTSQGTNQEAYEEAHGKLYDMTHKNTVPWRNWVVYIVLVSLLTCCFTFSKYMSEAGGSNSVTVAKFSYQIVTDGINGVTINQDNTMGSEPSVQFAATEGSKSYNFTVTNDSDVTVEVVPSASNCGLFDVYFIDPSNNNQQLESFYLGMEGNTAGLPTSKTITMVVDSSAITTKVDNQRMSLSFTVSQVD